MSSVPLTPFPQFRPAFMGIVNVTPDSFSDGTVDPAAAAARARALVAQGAHMLDFGAEASSFFRPGVVPVPAGEQLRRLLPVLERLSDLPADVRISIDTRSAAVAREILAQHPGTHADAPGRPIENRKSGGGGIENPPPRPTPPLIINDISAGTHDPALLGVVAQAHAAVILMHITPTYPATPAADDTDILQTVCDYLLTRAQAAREAGIPQNHIALDPGIGFGKTMPDNWRLALGAATLAARLAPYPLVLGTSRKRFLETQPPADTPLPPHWPALLAGFAHHAGSPSHPRDPASAALARVTGQAIHRLHHVQLAASGT